MLAKISNLSKKPFVRNVIVMATGTAAAQVVAMFASPIITRLYGPEAYGLMGTFQSIIQIILPVAALTYPVAIVLPKNNEDAKGIMRLSLNLSIIIAFITFIIILLFNRQIAQLFNIEKLAPYLYLIPVVIYFSNLMEINEQWLIRTKRFSIIAKTSFLRSLIINGSRIGIGLYYPFASVLILLTSLENGIKALLMKLFMRKSNYELKLLEGNQKSLFFLAKKYKDFPIYRAPQDFIDRVSQNLPQLLLAFYFGPVPVAFFTICRTVLSMPSQLIGKSIGDVFYPRISEAGNKGESLTRLIIKATLALVAMGILPFGLIIIFGPWIFAFVFGSDWQTAGEYARWIAIWVFFMYINNPSMKALPVMSAQAFQLKYAIFTLMMRTLAFLTGYYFFSSELVSIALFSITAGLLSLVLVLITLRISKKFDMKDGKLTGF